MTSFSHREFEDLFVTQKFTITKHHTTKPIYEIEIGKLYNRLLLTCLTPWLFFLENAWLSSYDDATKMITSSSDDNQSFFQKNWPGCQTH